MVMLNIAKIDGFQWDQGNKDKNWLKHHVTFTEAEQVFFNQPLIIQTDHKHTKIERRLLIAGQTNHGRHLTIILTIRKNHIRIISARDMSKKERNAYEEIH